MTTKDGIINSLKKALEELDYTSSLRLTLIQTIEYLQEEPEPHYPSFEEAQGEVILYGINGSVGMQEKSRFHVGQTIADPTDPTFTFHINMIEDGKYIESYDSWVLIKDADEEYELVEEPKRCMYPKDHYTDEDRKVLCKDCEEECEYSKKEPVSKVWHDMIEEAENGRNIIIIDPKNFYGAVLRKGGTQLKNHNKERYVKWAYIDDIINVTNKEEPVSIWHDAKEPPEMYRKYFARYSDGRINGSWERHDDGFIPWKDVIKEHNITHWCYVEDLLKL